MKYLFLDTETTGLIDNSLRPLSIQPHIIEFYGALVDEKAKILEELQFLCDPGILITDEITEITKITNKDLKGKKSIESYLPSMQAIAKKADAVVVQNLSYDHQMIELECKRYDFKFAWPRIKICTVEETEWINGYRLSLGKMHEWLFGKAFDNAHRAKDDTKALIACFFELRKRELICLG